MSHGIIIGGRRIYAPSEGVMQAALEASGLELRKVEDNDHNRSKSPELALCEALIIMLGYGAND
jgi:hypothetical protein